jgi:hypothetical protein
VYLAQQLVARGLSIQQALLLTCEVLQMAIELLSVGAVVHIAF